MDNEKLDTLLAQASADLLYVIHEVGKRGVLENQTDVDDFGILLQRKEFKDLVVGEMYEAYFLPERHESDWQILHDIAAIIASEQLRAFVAASVVSGVLGNAAYAALRALLARVITEMKKCKLAASKRLPFQAMRDDVEKIEAFFRQKECAQIVDVEMSTGVPRERLYPLLKLLGFKHYNQHGHYWCAPGPVRHQLDGHAATKARR
jgi:hypothetical protein